MSRRIAWLALLVLGLSLPAAAQRRPNGSPAPAGDATAVRAELAAVLLQARRYPEAAREYRVLLARQPNDFGARLGLARALAWGNQPREAERELRILRVQRPADNDVDELLRSVRGSFEPGSAEASAWVAERPGHAPYRRALARALVREGKARSAIPHYDQLLVHDRSTAFVLEAVNAQVTARENERAANLLRGLLERAPGDTSVRHALANTLAGARQYDAALATYDTLIAWYPGPALLLERGQVHLARRDLSAAEADALASLTAGPSVGAYLLLGDLRRWRGNYAEARVVYGYARVMRPKDPAVIAGSAQLIRDERPIIAFVGYEDLGGGWHFQSSSVSDNAGINYATVSARRQVDLVHGMVGSVDADVRRLGGEQMAGLAVGITGFGMSVGLMRELARGPYVGRLSGRAGLVQHDGGSTLGGAVRATGWTGAWGLSLEYAVGPAYPTLLTAGSLRPPGSGGKPLTEASSSLSVGGPVARADVALSVQRADISDDNRRSTVQALVRYPLTENLSALYSGTGIWFTERSTLYWNPSSYIANAAGVELAMRRPRGFSFASRVLAGAARSVEEVVVDRRPIDQTQTALQLSGGGDLSYRTESRQLGAAVTYGSGRTGSYRRFEANVYVRLLR